MKFSSLEKLVRILSIHNYITKSIKSANLANITAYMLCNPKFIETVRNFKPTELEMYKAFLMLVKTSQTLYPPSSKYFKQELKDSILVASLRFDDSKAEEILEVRHLPLISSKDVDLVKLLFLKDHILETGPFNLHLKGCTLSRNKQGIFATVIPNVRRIIKPHLKHCVKCLKTAKELQTFSSPLGNPRFFFTAFSNITEVTTNFSLFLEPQDDSVLHVSHNEFTRNTQSKVSALLSLCPRIFVVSLWFCLLLYNFLAATVSNSKSVSCPVTTSHFTSQGSDKAHDEYQRVVLCPDGACLRAVHNQQGISCEVHHQLHHVPELSRYLLSTSVANAVLFSKLRPETSSHNFGINPQEPSDTGTRILDELTPLLPSTSMP